MRTTVNPFSSALRPDMTRGTEKLSAQQENERLRQVAGEFEAIMMEQMMREMRKSIPKAELLGQAMGQEMFTEMLDGEFVRLMVERGGLGMRDSIAQSLEKKSGILTKPDSSSPVNRR